MNEYLRHLTIFVDEPERGEFYWVLIESTEDASIWRDVDAAQESVSTWEAAFDAGVAELKRLVADKRRGPVAVGEDEGSSPVG